MVYSVFFYVDEKTCQFVSGIFLRTVQFSSDFSCRMDVTLKGRKSLARSHKKTNEMRIVPVCAFCYDYNDIFHFSCFRHIRFGKISSHRNFARIEVHRMTQEQTRAAADIRGGNT